MKKFALYSLATAFALSFAACDNYEEPNPQPQTNPQENVLQTSDVTVTSDLTAEPYVLQALNDAGEVIKLATIDAPTLPSVYTLLADVEISSNNFGRSASVPTTVEVGEDGKYVVTVSPDDLQGVYYSNISKGPNQKDIKVRMVLKTSVTSADGKNSQIAYVGGPQNYYGPYDMKVVPFPSDLVIEDNYYLLGTINGWGVATAVKLNHSDMSPYDDPIFTLKVDITANQAAEGWWWKIIPESTYVTGDWVSAKDASFGPEVNGSEDLSGLLYGRTEEADSNAGCLKTDGQLLLTINMEEGTYEFTSAVDCLYTPGNSNGWNHIASQLLSTTDYSNYTGYAHLNGSFKFSNAPDWNHINYGAGASEGELSTDGGAGDLSAPNDALYWCNVNTASLSYSITEITSVSLIGEFNNWESDLALTPDESFLIWKGEVKFDGGEWKFRMNNGWDLSLGGSLENLIPQSDFNLVAPGSDTYIVTLDLSQLPYSATVVKK